jgi:hypothetical protein
MSKLTAQGWHEHKLPADLTMQRKEADLLRDAVHIVDTGRYLGDGGICTEPARSIIKALVNQIRKYRQRFEIIEECGNLPEVTVARASLRETEVLRADDSRPDSSPRCCLEHLERMGYGQLTQGGEWLTNPNHCVDGKRARCRTCHRVWEYTCDEAEGCAWTEVRRGHR